MIQNPTLYIMYTTARHESTMFSITFASFSYFSFDVLFAVVAEVVDDDIDAAASSSLSGSSSVTIACHVHTADSMIMDARRYLSWGSKIIVR